MSEQGDSDSNSTHYRRGFTPRQHRNVVTQTPPERSASMADLSLHVL